MVSSGSISDSIHCPSMNGIVTPELPPGLCSTLGMQQGKLLSTIDYNQSDENCLKDCSTANIHPAYRQMALSQGKYLVHQIGPPIFNYHNLTVYVVGAVGHPKASIVRVVHISDTRGVHEAFAHTLPRGDILIHSGDFRTDPPHRISRSTYGHIRKQRRQSSRYNSGDWQTELRGINNFFDRQPHPFKIFVPGCWDYFVENHSETPTRPTAAEIQQHLPSAIYLEDAWCQVLGLRIYGVPWTAADDLRPEDGAYSTPSRGLGRWWTNLPGSFRRRRSRLASPNDGNPTPTESSRAPPSFQNRGSTAPCDIANGFILPTIQAVKERFDHVPEGTNILISHMPAWRPELYTQVVDRIKYVILNNYCILYTCRYDQSPYDYISAINFFEVGVLTGFDHAFG